ncbi:hypothetical protein [Pantoea ananatis]|nr:hypothetical protein [Pantoea ananatis]
MHTDKTAIELTGNSPVRSFHDALCQAHHWSGVMEDIKPCQHATAGN